MKGCLNARFCQAGLPQQELNELNVRSTGIASVFWRFYNTQAEETGYCSASSHSAGDKSSYGEDWPRR